ncbi:MAG: hypothetical protein AUJ92_21800 [Armatimonadetes bacterium CG2_30_59_28]|nr:DUF1559 domain-containing protein [Armatimonadota bacterium]OIO89285.1 MAG: hypothetical protein AUJ92_21800 [Armatimonadetes bacterium CG2_30_59_28]PIU62693.1 MAG: hypothetical protein COS85_17835 [Armatimonadetes bacterium CG07_land_8_20_14_0_80_59_28]PIX46016.1 MAG: hypothetical protein COZ56_00565 [Armatimonadetes bacterium CG_4_8_14_3_um_filter_58_9]PJB64626.1 MAG: hypothetical protein CO095_14745 [Armatimonadetes bacterium CG_4_9_14_3_um_filter_58_7]
MFAQSPNPESGTRHPKFGFTLIELLVVIGIIVVLAGIIFPVFSKAREKGRSVKCQSNLKQIGGALEMYIADWDQRLPDSQPIYWLMPGCTKNKAAVWAPDPDPDPDPSKSLSERKTALELSWMGALQPYTKSWEIFTCPSRQKLAYTDGKSGYAYNGTFWSGVQNACGAIVGSQDSTSGLDGYRKITSIDDVTDTIMVTDSPTNGKPELDGGTDTTGKLCPSDYADGEKPHARHNGGFNALFADGKVKWVRSFKDYQFTIEKDATGDITCP